MQIFDAEMVRQQIDYPSLLTSLKAMLRRKREQTAFAPQRIVLPLGNEANLLLMPATDQQYTMTKLVTVHPHNHQHHLSSVAADVLILDTQTGQRLALADGETITNLRTAALSALAWQTLAPDNHGALLIIGAGRQAHAHLEAFARLSEVPHVFVYSRTPANAQHLVETAQQQHLNASVVTEIEPILPLVTRIITATTSSTPVLQGTIRNDACIFAVGAYRPTMVEVTPAIVQSARIYVDTLEGCQAEAGDLIQAEVDWQTITPLEIAIEQSPPAQDRPILFKSVGHALWDLAAVACLTF